VSAFEPITAHCEKCGGPYTPRCAWCDNPTTGAAYCSPECERCDNPNHAPPVVQDSADLHDLIAWLSDDAEHVLGSGVVPATVPAKDRRLRWIAALAALHNAAK
jgi:hypothetical protein